MIKKAKIAAIEMWHRIHFLDLQQFDHWLNGWITIGQWVSSHFIVTCSLRPFLGGQIIMTSVYVGTGWIAWTKVYGLLDMHNVYLAVTKMTSTLTSFDKRRPWPWTCSRHNYSRWPQLLLPDKCSNHHHQHTCSLTSVTQVPASIGCINP